MVVVCSACRMSMGRMAAAQVTMSIHHVVSSATAARRAERGTMAEHRRSQRERKQPERFVPEDTLYADGALEYKQRAWVFHGCHVMTRASRWLPLAHKRVRSQCELTRAHRLFPCCCTPRAECADVDAPHQRFSPLRSHAGVADGRSELWKATRPVRTWPVLITEAA